MANEAILSVTDLYKAFSGVEVLNGITLTVRQGERHAVIGPNGAGKTTLFNCITGKFKVRRGRVAFSGHDITGMAPHRITRLGLARSFQITNIFNGLTVFENMRAAVLSRRGVRMETLRRADAMTGASEECLALLERIGLADKRGLIAGELAYGEQRALEIGLAMAMMPRLIMLDEPTAGMSMEETRHAIELIRRISEGHSLVIIEHDMDVVFSLADAITVIQYGKVIASGPPEEIRQNPSVKEAYLGEH